MLYGAASGGPGGVGSGPGAGGKALGGSGPGGAGEEEEADPVEKESKAGKKEGRQWLDAAMGGRLDELRAMCLLEPTIIHFKGQGLGQTALHWACAKGHAPAVRFLLDKGANVESMNNNSSRPLHAAAASGSMECVTMLMTAGCKVDKVDGDGRSCEKIASGRGHDQVAGRCPAAPLPRTP